MWKKRFNPFLDKATSWMNVINVIICRLYDCFYRFRKECCSLRSVVVVDDHDGRVANY